MSYCLNPYCPDPKNSDASEVCHACGEVLWLGDRFRALGVLGEGGFGRTYLAIDEADPQRLYCVIKQAMPVGKVRQEAERRMFQQEADRLAQLGAHPQIPTLLARAERGSSQYLVQEYVDGLNLEELLQRDGPFSELQLRRVLQDLLPVLQFIHSQQVIHRDIKPQNIIEPAQGGRLVLVDFGASKYATETALARTGTMIGSAGYAAPEQAMGKAEFASDLYSLGVTCIHLLTGQHPFDLYSVSDDAWVWTPFLPKPVSAELVRVLNRMLQKPLRQRYGQTQAIARDLNLEAAPVLVNATTDQTLISGKPEASALTRTAPPGQMTVVPPRYWQCVQQLTGHAGAITCIAISGDGQTLASGSTDRSVRLWDPQTGELQHTFTGRSLWFGSGHSERVNTLAFTADGNTLASGSDDGTIKLWDLTTQRLLATLTVGWSVTAIALGREYLVSGSGDGILTLWDLASHELLREIGKHRDQVSGLILSADGQTLISSSHDKTIRLWDLKTNRVITTLRDHTQPVSAIAISADWQRLVSASWDRTLKIWDLSRLTRVRSFIAHKSRIGCLAYSPDGGLLASSGEDQRIGIWALGADASGALSISRLNYLRHDWAVNALCFSPDSGLLISGGADETLQIWKAIRQ